jgi:large subunit ribosomal protein L9
MEIILLQDIDKVGERNEIVKVKDGYGRNYLIPQGMALIANDTNRKNLAARLRSEDKKEAAMMGEYNATAAKVAEKTVTIAARAGASGKLFGSINATQVAEALEAQLGVAVDRKKVLLPEIKEVGEYTTTVKLHKTVMPTFTLVVAAAEAEG